MHTLHLIDLLYILQVILTFCIYITSLIYKLFEMVHASAGQVWETGLTNEEMHIRCRCENEPFTGKRAVGKRVVLRREADGLLPKSQRWKGEMRVSEVESVQGTCSSTDSGGKGRCASER